MRADADKPSMAPADVGLAGRTNGHAPLPAAGDSEANSGWFAVNAEAPAIAAAPAKTTVTEETPLPEAAYHPELDPAEAQPDVLVESGGNDLALGQFFRPAMWGLAWVPVLLTGLLSFSTLIRTADSVSIWPYALPAYVDVYGQVPPVGLIGRHLLPTGMPMSVASSASFGQEQTIAILQGDMLLGIAGLLLGMLIVVMVTRRSNDAIYVCGPYAVYSLAAVAMLSLNGPLFDGLAGLFPALLGAIVLPLLVGTLAKIAAIAMRNAGIFDIDQELATGEGVDFTSAPEGVAVIRPGLGSQAVLGSAQATAAAQDTGTQAIAFAQVCPFCGNPNIQHEDPKVCTACHHNLRLVFEHRDGARCSDCGGILVRDAVFCHHCSKWQKAPEAMEESTTMQGAA